MAKTNWVIDPQHSEISFRVRHLMITSVSGKFEKFNATAEIDDADFTKSSVHFEADASSVNTNAEQRDTHIRGSDFFNSPQSPKITFQSAKIEKEDEKNYVLHGDLAMNGITKPVKLDVEVLGIMKDPYGRKKAGFSLHGKVNRKEWNINWNVALETGGVLVSDEVQIHCEVQMLEQQKTTA